MNGIRHHVTDTKPTSDQDWDAKEEMVLGVLEMYCQKDIWTTVSDNTKFSTCKAKWVEIKYIYGGVGSMSSFNTWVALTSTTLNKSNPMLP
jgi:hypothetical protein